MALQGSKTAKALVALSAFVPNLFLVDEIQAQPTAAETMDIAASVVNPLFITPSFSFSLNFNSFAVKGTGTVTIQPTGAGTINQGLLLGGVSAGSAVLNVPQNVPFTLTIPTFKLGSSIIMKNGAGGVPSKEITAKSIFLASRSNMSNATQTLKVGNASANNMKITDIGGMGKIAVGASIVFGANQVTGLYSGTFVVRMTL